MGSMDIEIQSIQSLDCPYIVLFNNFSWSQCLSFLLVYTPGNFIHIIVIQP